VTAADDARGLTSVAQDYLKVIFNVQEWSGEKVSTKMLAERIGVSASTASESIRKLADQGLVEHEKYGAVTLTDRGRRAAVSVVSDLMLSRIDAQLGYPERDPHGDPIPSLDGRVPTPPARQLSTCADGEHGSVARISDADPEMLRYFDSVGIALDSHLTVLTRRDFAGTVSVAIDDGHHGNTAEHTVELGSPAAESIWVVPC
jgi:DtxR family Mn-dependent transcriptional regulator